MTSISRPLFFGQQILQVNLLAQFWIWWLQLTWKLNDQKAVDFIGCDKRNKCKLMHCSDGDGSLANSYMYMMTKCAKRWKLRILLMPKVMVRSYSWRRPRYKPGKKNLRVSTSLPFNVFLHICGLAEPRILKCRRRVNYIKYINLRMTSYFQWAWWDDPF